MSPAILAFVGVGATVVKGTGAVISATVQSRLAQNVAAEARAELAAKLLRGGSSMPPGPLSARVAIALREIEAGVGDGFLNGLKAFLALVPLAIGLWTVSSPLAWVSVLMLAPFAIGMALARRRWKRAHRSALSVAESVHQELDQLVAHMDVWRTFGAGERIGRKLDQLAREAALSAGRAEGSRAALSSANEVLAALTLLLCVAATRVFRFPIADGHLIAFAALFFMAYRPLRDLGDAGIAIERGAQALSLLEPLASGEVTRSTPGEVKARRWTRETLVVEGTGVDRSEVRTSFSAEPGEIVAIVGPTGAGKTTLLRVLLGLEPGAAGRISYGRDDLAGAGVGPSARPFAWMPQDAPVLAGTFAENLLVESSDASALLARMGAPSFAHEREALGAAGRAVSGGERKWIGLARALASDLPVLLLDEPTAGLDGEAQARVLAALARLRGERTIVIVSHQADVVAIADRVVRLGDQNCARNRGSFSNIKRTSGIW